MTTDNPEGLSFDDGKRALSSEESEKNPTLSSAWNMNKITIAFNGRISGEQPVDGRPALQQARKDNHVPSTTAMPLSSEPGTLRFEFQL